MQLKLRRLELVIAISGSLGVLLYAYLHFSETALFPSFKKFEGFIYHFILNCLAGTVLYLANRKLDKWISWKTNFTPRFVVGFIASFVLIICTYRLAALITNPLHNIIYWKDFSLNDEDLFLKVAILVLAVVFVYKIVYALLYSYQQYAVTQIELLQRERKQRELQFQALKSQVSPHYLFNSLNTISSLIYKDPQTAEQFIRRLAQTYQYILSTQDKQFVLLKEEVEFVQSFYYLLRIRFQQQLNVEINLPMSIMNSKIPPLTLQILVENAVKHNNLTDKKLLIYITAQDNTHLKIINTKTGMVAGVQSFKIGLENIKKRYQYFTNEKIEVRDEDQFMVSLPVLQNVHERMEQKFSA